MCDCNSNSNSNNNNNIYVCVCIKLCTVCYNFFSICNATKYMESFVFFPSSLIHHLLKILMRKKSIYNNNIVSFCVALMVGIYVYVCVRMEFFFRTFLSSNQPSERERKTHLKLRNVIIQTKKNRIQSNGIRIRYTYLLCRNRMHCVYKVGIIVFFCFPIFIFFIYVLYIYCLHS